MSTAPARDLLAGRIDARAYAVLRIGIALIVLVRTTRVLAPFVDLDHHGWVAGLEYAPWDEPVTAPRLDVPLIPGIDVLTIPTVAAIAVVARTALAGWLLTGIAPRATAGALALVGWATMAADRFRYLHHLHLLWVVCALLALAPRPPRAVPWSPRWPMQLLRFQALVVYAASGIAKLTSAWCSGATMASLGTLGLVDARLVDTLGAQPLALATVAIELALVPLLAVRRTRTIGLVLALGFHATTAATMLVSSFPWTMALLVTAFLPWREEHAPAAETAPTEAAPRRRASDP